MVDVLLCVMCRCDKEEEFKDITLKEFCEEKFHGLDEIKFQNTRLRDKIKLLAHQQFYHRDNAHVSCASLPLDFVADMR